MKKVFSMMLAAVMLFALAVSAGAAEVSSEAGNEISPQYVALSTLSPTLTFSGKNVTCAVLARTKESTAKITLSMTLYEVSSSGLMTKVAGWNNLTGTGRVSTSKVYANAVSGRTYRLAVNATVKDSSGTHYDNEYRSGKCP